MSRLALLIEYDGTPYAGWQNQLNGVAVQQRIEEALELAYGTKIGIVGSGRTDAGVHARGQVAHLTLPEDAAPIPFEKITVALNTRLPRDIRIRSVARVDSDFHARFGAIEREYVYRISTEYSVFERTTVWTPDAPFDAEQFVEACRGMPHIHRIPVQGVHDFTTFSKHNASTESYVCDLRELSAHYHAPYIDIRIRADRFVYGMCRLLVGAVMSVARSRVSLEELAERLAAKDRSLQLGSAPAHGLYLNRVRYENGVFDDVFANATYL